MTKKADPRVSDARAALLEGVGEEVAASFPGITRLGGQVVAALYLAGAPQSMDALCETLGRSKSNVFSNLRALTAAGIVERRREARSRHDVFALKGRYPDVIVGAYIGRLRRVVRDKQELSRRALGILGDAKGTDADALRHLLDELLRKYDRFADLLESTLPPGDPPVDIEGFLDRVPAPVLEAVQQAVRRAFDDSKR